MIPMVVALLFAVPLQEEKLQTCKAGDLTLQAPADWEVVSEEGKTLLTLVTLQEGEADTFRENLRISAVDVAAGTSIDALMAASVKAIEKEGVLKIAGKGGLTANGHKVIWLSMRPKQPRQGQEPLTLVEYGFVVGTKAYSFKAMAADKQLDKFKAAVEKVLKSVEPKAGK